MPKFEFCIPTTGKVVPAGAEWFHEIKYEDIASAWNAMATVCG